MRDMKNGDVYYEDEESGDTSWDAPTTDDSDIIDQRSHAGSAGGETKSNDLKNPLNTGSEDQLPDGWEAAYDDDNDIYFFNEETDETTRDHPLNKTLPGAWEVVYDEDGDMYYYNEETGKTSWVRPTA